MPQNVSLISNADYLLFTTAWKQLDPNTNLNSYFQTGGVSPSQPVYGIRFPISGIKALLSTVGITKIMARFCIENGQFNIILFGTDASGTLSGYYMGSSVSTPHPGGGTAGNIPQWLAEEWINNWKNYVTTSGTSITTATLFVTKYGLLNGYTYEIKEFMEALYKGASTEPAYVMLHFSLHQYYRSDNIDIDHPTNTFDLVLQRAKSENEGINPGDDDTPYYDITNPCPPICGGGD